MFLQPAHAQYVTLLNLSYSGKIVGEMIHWTDTWRVKSHQYHRLGLLQVTAQHDYLRIHEVILKDMGKNINNLTQTKWSVIHMPNPCNRRYVIPLYSKHYW